MKKPLRAKSSALTHESGIKPLPTKQVTNPCPLCHNTAYLQKHWTPPEGYDRRMRQFRCMQGHEHYQIPKNASKVLDPPQ